MRAGIALGSNIEPRLVHLQNAKRRISELNSGSEPVLASKVYETSPVDCEAGTANFLNAVLEISVDLSPEELFEKLQRIENDMGRPANHARNSPRCIDLDILYYGNITVKTEKLTIPHPRIAEREFVLRPLADIRALLELPFVTKTIEQLLNVTNVENIKVYSNSID